MKTRVIWLFVACMVWSACETPCTQLNERMVARYDECGVTIPEDLEDGGRGACGSDERITQCVGDCYEQADCSALDGSDPAAVQALDDCDLACNEV